MKIIDTWKLGADKTVTLSDAIQDQVYDNSTSYDDEMYCLDQVNRLQRIVEVLMNKVGTTVIDLNEIVGHERYKTEFKTTNNSDDSVVQCLEEIIGIQKDVIEYPGLYTNLGVIREIVERIENRFGV